MAKKTETTTGMNLGSKIQTELNQALKAKDEPRVNTLRFVLAQIKDAQIEKRGELEDEEVIKLLQKIEKQQTEAITLFQKGQRQDLVDKEEKERAIIRSFLPQPLSEQEVETLVEQVLTREGGPGNFGQVMSEVMKQVAGRADGKQVSEIVAKKLKS